MRILEVLTYYRPHISGLTIYVERLSKAFARQGHEVVVFTSQYESNLKLREIQDGVKIVRVPVAFRVSKGVIMPRFGPQAWKMVNQSDIVHLHLPQFDAPGVAFRGRLYRKPVILTYHSDLQLPEGSFNRMVDMVVHSMNRIAGNLADAVVTYTLDFGSNSPYLKRYLGKKLHVIPPPVELKTASDEDVKVFRSRHNIKDWPTIGISARMAAEKGIEILLRALPEVLEEFPKALILHASPQAIGEENYAVQLAPILKKYETNYLQLGPLQGSDLTAFYRNLSCLVMCSLNNTETFGLVQIEAMMNGVPVIASNLPGVRQPVQMTGMGEITEVGNHIQLAQAIKNVLSNRDHYERSSKVIANSFDPDKTASEYLNLFEDLMAGRKSSEISEPTAYKELKLLNNAR
jgi:glycosyltransferase involved in cell wall biosynthesis